MRDNPNLVQFYRDQRQARKPKPELPVFRETPLGKQYLELKKSNPWAARELMNANPDAVCADLRLIRAIEERAKLAAQQPTVDQDDPNNFEIEPEPPQAA